MAIMETDFPLTYEGLLDLYFDLYNRFNQSSDSTQLLQDQIDYLNGQMQQMELNYSNGRADYENRISKLNSDLTNAKSNAGPSILLYIVTIIAALSLFYIFMTKWFLPWRRGER
jgi:hypothetical protein